MPDPHSNAKRNFSSRRSWLRKFQDAFRGMGQGMRGQSSFVVHSLATLAVIALAAILQVSLLRWCLLVLCIGSVIGAELFNSSLESLARSITQEHDSDIQRGLNIASGAVLAISIMAAAVGALIFLSDLLG